MSNAIEAETSKRYTVVGMCFAAVFVCYIDRVNISVAAIAMQSEFGWSETTKGLVLSSFFVGYMLTQALAGWLADRFGGKLVLGVAVVWWSLFTVLTPWAAYGSFALLIAARIALGLGEAATFPASYGMFSRWVPADERARSISLLASGVPIGTLFALISTGWIVANYGWPAVFYWFGIAGILWAAGWFLFVHDHPASHPRISRTELDRIGPAATSPGQRLVFPWRAFLRLPAFWALLVNHFCCNVLLYVALAWLPSYFRDAQGLSLTGAGLYSAAPWLSMFALTNLAGWLADHLQRRGWRTVVVRKTMQTTGLVGGAVFLLMLQEVDSANLAVLLMCGVLGLASFCVSGYATNHLDIAPKYAGVLLGITNTVATIPGIVGVALTGWLVETTGSYDSVFVMVACVNLVAVTVWLLFAKAEQLVD